MAMQRHARIISLRYLASSLPLYRVSIVGGMGMPYSEIAVFKYESVPVQKKFLGFIPYTDYIWTWQTLQVFEGRYPTMQEGYARYLTIGDELDKGNMSCLYADDNRLDEPEHYPFKSFKES